MTEAAYWWCEAARYAEQAAAAVDAEERRELLALAETCTEVAVEIEERAGAG